MIGNGNFPGPEGKSGPARIIGAAIAALVVATALTGVSATGALPGGTDQAEAAACKNVRLGSRALKKGHCGEDVRALNWFLNAKKYGVKPNGKFRSKTRKAVRKLQKEAGLTRDGIVGNQTIKKMKKRMGSGYASWYGPGFWGNNTACGKKLKKGTVGVAVPAEKIGKYPCGSRILLNHGGRWVRARVIDTGGFSKYGRKWDLTERTAKLLNPNYKSEGVFKVRAVVRKK